MMGCAAKPVQQAAFPELAALRDSIEHKVYKKVKAAVVYQGGEVLVEEYYNGMSSNDIHDARSVGKSFASALLGISIDEGHISSLDLPISDFYDLKDYKNYSEEKGQIKLRHLATMSSNFFGNDDDMDTPGNEEHMYDKPNWVQWTLNLPLDQARNTGESWQYFTAGVVVLDNNGAITECNPAAENLLGTPLLSRQWRDVVENSFSPRWDDGHDMTLVDGRSVNISTQSLDGESGQLVLLKEVTETRQLQEQLGQLKRLSAMGEMAASLAHQIRTPLSTAVLYASNLKNTYCDRARQLRFTEKLLSRLQHLETLIEDMLLFARGGSFDFKCYRIRDLLEDFVKGIEQLQGRVTISLDVSKLDQSVEVNVNQHAISSVLQNLVDNSINASSGPLQLTIEAGISDEGWLEILVSDDGPGIPGDVQDKIFDPFFTTRSSGTGLGLAVADSVIKSHGGTIRLLKENKLTTFRIKLPVASD